MGTSNRARRAAKQRQRDQRRGRPPGAGSGVHPEVAGPSDRGLPPEALRRVLHDSADDLAAGRDGALVGLRHLLAEHLARRRAEILAAGDAVLVADDLPERATGIDPADPLAAALARAATSVDAGETPVSTWAARDGIGTEDAVVATVRVLAAARTATA